jgi:DNA polymerase V
MQCLVTEISAPDFSTKLTRPVLATRVSAGFPSPAEDYIEGRIDLNRELIKHPLATFYIRVKGDSMEPDIPSNALLMVDRMEKVQNGDIVVARLDEELCVKVLRILDNGDIWLCSVNESYKPFPICEEDDFEVWGKVIYSINAH